MRILLVSDIHANWPALQAIKEPYDVCLFLGDLVDYGLDPSPCIQWVRRHATYAVRGNHDHHAAQFVKVNGKNGFKYLTTVTRAVTQERISSAERRFLASLPVTRTVTLENTSYLMVHATPRDPMDEYAGPDAALWATRLQDLHSTVVCVGHTHFPYVLEVGDNLVVNPGSLGQPRDGDPRASYAVIDNHRVDLKRIEYPVQDTIRSVLESPLNDHAKALLAEVFRAGGLTKADPAKARTAGEPGKPVAGESSRPGDSTKGGPGEPGA